MKKTALAILVVFFAVLSLATTSALWAIVFVGVAVGIAVPTGLV